jgi:hypothetical protein
MDQYLKFVGSYVGLFANLEHDLLRLCHDYSGLSRPAFRIFMSKRAQLGDKIDILKKFIALENLDDETKLAVRDAFNQLDHLIALRHRIVHHGGNPYEGKIVIRAKETDLSKETNKPYDLYTELELWLALGDLHLVRNILRYHLDRSLDQEFRDSLAINAVRKKPWNYKGRERLPLPK